MANTALGQFLRARREQVHPGDVGLSWSGRRRVPGLRREEVATLAGVSVDYYVRLEQGRDIQPSAQVINALARALLLDDHAAGHLHALANWRQAASHDGDPERVDANVVQLIGSLRATPAFVYDRFMDVLASNAVVRAIAPIVKPGTNLVRATFLEPDLRQGVSEWDVAAASIVARLRSMAGSDLHNPRLVELVDEISARSPEFRELWARHEVVVSGPRHYVLDHPQIGRLVLHPVLLAVVGVDAQFVVAHCSAPGSSSRRALERVSRTLV